MNQEEIVKAETNEECDDTVTAEENNSSPSEIAETDVQTESASDSSSLSEPPDNGKPKKVRTFAIAAIAVLLVVCSAVAAVLIYDATSTKGLSFDRIEDMESYANGYYIYEGRILCIEGSNYSSCYISDIRFDDDEYIDKDNYTAKKLKFDIDDNLALIQHFISEGYSAELGYYINKGVLANNKSNEKMFAVQGDGVLMPLYGNGKEPIKRIAPEKLLEESAELKSALEEFRSDYDNAVAEIEAKKPKAAYFPTVDEYISKFKKLKPDFTRTDYYNDNYVLLKWKIEYNRLVTFSYQLMLFVNTENRVTSCYVSITDTHFYNKFANLLNNEAQINTYICVTFPAFLLCSMHNGIEYDKDEFSKFTASKLGELNSKGEYSATYNGCEFYVSISEYLFTCSLDFGNIHKNDPKASSAGNNSTAKDSNVFKIGGTGPLTGGAEIFGNAVKNAAELAVEEINAKGGDIQFELRYEDDAHDAETAVSAYHTLKNWGMQIFLGSATPKPCEATSAESFADRYFALTPSASSTAVLEGKDNVFQMCFMDPNQGSASAQYISDNQLGKRIAIIYKSDDAYSTGALKTFKAKAAELNLSIVSETSFSYGADSDFTAQIKDAQTKGADLVFLPIYYTPASLILTQADQMGYAPTWFGIDGMDGILTIEGFNTDLAEGVMLLTPFNADSTDEATKAFVEAYQNTYGEIPNQFAAEAYDCIYAIYNALKAGKATPDMDKEALCDLLVEQFTSMTFDGLTGEGMTWDETGAVTKSPKGMVIKNGAYVGLD